MADWKSMTLDLVSPDDHKRNRAKFFYLSVIYDGLIQAIPGEPYQSFAEKIAAGKPDRVLDICSGTGYTARNIARLLPAGQIDALDISPEMLAVAKERSAEEGLGNINFHEESAAKLPFENSTFDAVCVSLGLHELPTSIRSSALKDIYRVLKPGGAIFAMDLDRPSSFGFLMDAYLAIGEPEYSKEVLNDGIKNQLKDFGFTGVTKQTWLADFCQVVEGRKPA